MIVTKITISYFKHSCNDIKVYKNRTSIEDRRDQRRCMIAGSSPIFFATSGRMHPMHFAIATTAIIVTPSAAASIRFLSYIIHIRTPLTTARRVPTISATLISLNITLNISENSISPTASPRMISVELCDPQFPPVPISMG